jgi:hypothetical protein
VDEEVCKRGREDQGSECKCVKGSEYFGGAKVLVCEISLWIAGPCIILLIS